MLIEKSAQEKGRENAFLIQIQYKSYNGVKYSSVANVSNNMKLRYLLLLAAIVSVQAGIPQLSPLDVPSRSLLVLYLYHPQCLTCLDQTLQFMRLAELQTSKTYEIGQINCAIWAKYCYSLPRNYPAIYLFSEGEQVIYSGEVKAESIDSWVKNAIAPQFPKITAAEVKKKEKKESFVLVGNLDTKEKIKFAAIRAERYITVPIYEIDSSKPVFSLYIADRDEPVTYSVPLNSLLVSFELFHRTRPHVMPLSTPQYLAYFHNQIEAEELLLFYNYGDDFAKNTKKYLQPYCHQYGLTVLCFSLEKDSPLIEGLQLKGALQQSNSSLTYFKQKKEKIYFYKPKSVSYQQLTKFIEEARNDKLSPDIDNSTKETPQENYPDALKLTTRTHKSTISNNPIVIVKYYSPSCKHCNKLAPHYNAVAQHFKQQGSKVVVAVLDAQEEHSVSDQQKIQKYPTIKVFVTGEAIEYEGQYTTEGFFEYLTAIEKGQLTIISSLSDIKKPALVISGIDDNSTLHKLPAFFHTFPIYWLKSEQTLRVNIYEQDDEVKKFSGKVKLTSVLKWLQEEGQPIIVNLGETKISKRLSNAVKQNKAILGLMNKGVQSIEGPVKFLNGFCKNKKDFVCGVATIGEDDYQHLVQWLNDKDTENNRLFWISLSQLKCYLFNENLENLTEKNLSEFIAGIKNGSVAQHIREEPKKEEQVEDEEIKAIGQQQAETESQSAEDQQNQQLQNNEL